MANLCPCSMGNSISTALNNLRTAKRLNPTEPEQSASATVLSREVRHINAIYPENPYQYLVRFRLESGEELELKVSEETYGTLTGGCTGTLTWQEEALIRFC